MPNERANRRKSSPASSETRVFNSASALPVPESSPADRENAVSSSSWTPEAAVSQMLARVFVMVRTEYLRLANELP